MLAEKNIGCLTLHRVLMTTFNSFCFSFSFYLQYFKQRVIHWYFGFLCRMWRAFNPQSCLLLVAVASAAPTGDEAGHLSEARNIFKHLHLTQKLIVWQVRQWDASVSAESNSVVKRSTRTVNSYQEIPTTTFSCAAQVLLATMSSYWPHHQIWNNP